MQKCFASLAMALLSVTLLLPTGSAQTAPQNPGQPPTGRGQMNREGREQHPQIRDAIRALENARHHLQSAAHDFGGHRAKALEHVNEALEECRQALESDKK